MARWASPDSRGGRALVVGRCVAESLKQRRKSANQFGAVLRGAEGNDGPRLLHLRDRNKPGSEIRRQHVSGDLSRVYSSRTHSSRKPGMIYVTRRWQCQWLRVLTD